MLVVGWAPAGATKIVVRADVGTGEARIMEFRAVDSRAIARPPSFSSSLLPDGGSRRSAAVVVTLPDSIITRFGQEPAMSDAALSVAGGHESPAAGIIGP